MINYTKLLGDLFPRESDRAEGTLHLRVATVAVVNADGTVDITLSGVTIPDVPRLAGISVAVNDAVQVLALRGSLLVLGPVADSAEADAASTSSGASASAGFTVTTFTGRKVAGVTSATLFVACTSTITATAGNIPDTAMVTLPAGYRPPETISVGWSNGTVEGEATITAAGLVALRTCTGASLASGTNVRLHAVWIN